MEIITKARKWGSSLAVILPKKLVDETHIRENDNVVIDVKKRVLVRELFGKFPQWKKPSQDIKNEMRSGWKD